MKRIVYNKLVRDRIPEIIEKNGLTATTHSADEKEYEQKLMEKLHEEVKEISQNPNEEELADALEVIYALSDLKGYDREEIEIVRQKKVKERGGFTERIILEETHSLKEDV